MELRELSPQSLDSGTFQVDFPSLIKVLGENLYANPRACVRELIQNANDSCVRRQSAGQTFVPAIHVLANAEERTLVFEDNGAGMLHEDVVRYLASIGGGRTRSERVRLSTEDKNAANMLIGQFGIGFLSSFVVADRVIVDTLSIEGDAPIRWICEGSAEYQIGTGERSTPGTRVQLFLKASHFDLLEEETLINTIVYYADFIGFPIYLNTQETPINRMRAPWHQESNLEDYATYIQHRYGVAPLALEPVNVMRDDLIVQGVLFVPPRNPEWKRHLRSIDLFQKRMFIGEDLHILPEWAGFISGILDCATLDLVASRESAIGERPSYKALQTYLGEAVTAFVQRLATQERSTFLEVINQHEWAVKWGAVRNDFFFKQVKDLIPIGSDMGQLTVPKYLQRSPERLGGIKTIYYVPGQQVPGQQQSTVFRARGVPIFCADVVDEQFLKKYAERDNSLNLRQMVSGVVEMMDFVEGDQWRTVEARYQQMGITARGVRFHPPEMPALAVRRSDYDRDQMIDQVVEGNRSLFDFIGRVGKETSDAYELCFNTDNPIIQRLANYQGSQAIQDAALQSIYSSALLAAGVELTAELSQSVAQAEMHVIELLLQQDEQLQGKGVSLPTGSTMVAPPAAPPLQRSVGATTDSPVPFEDDGAVSAPEPTASRQPIEPWTPPLGTATTSQPPPDAPAIPAASYAASEPFAAPSQAMRQPASPAARSPSGEVASAGRDAAYRPFQSPHQERWAPARTYETTHTDPNERPFRDPEHSRKPGAQQVGPSPEEDPLMVRLMKKFLS
jgi:molecular chaperone HtpG